MALESEAYFRERAKAVGLADEEFAAVTAAGWRTLGQFAFATPQAPGAADDAPFVRDVVTPVLGPEPAAGPVA
eukprot:2046249-Lingulodinium_polyedra.AAC.1